MEITGKVDMSNPYCSAAKNGLLSLYLKQCPPHLFVNSIIRLDVHFIRYPPFLIPANESLMHTLKCAFS